MIRKLKILLLGLMMALCACRALAVDSLVLSQSKLGNIFLSTETVQIPLQTTGDHVSWTATDFFGVPTTGAAITVTGGQATIAPALGRLGYFDLHVIALRNGSPVASADTTFAVVAPSTVSTMHDSPFGLVCHFAQGWATDVMQLMARGGVAQFRDEAYWQTIEPTRTATPTYNFTTFDPYMSAAANLGLDPLVTLDFSNPGYDSGYSPYTDDGRTGYANYGTALLNHYSSQIDSVAIWNEYNGSFNSGPASGDLPTYYAAMLQKAYTTLKAFRPGVRVVGGASVPVPQPWFENLFAKGALDYMDAMDVHPYRSIPEGVETELSALQTVSAAYNHGNGPKPIWATECGYPDLVNQGRQNMSRYLVRLMTLMRTSGVERVYWYLAFDYGGYNYGVVRSPTDPLGPYAATSAFPAYSNLIQQLYGATYVGRENTDARTRFYKFHRGANDVHVAWSTYGTAQLVLTASAPLTRINIMGESTVLQPTNGLIALTVDQTPFYLVGSISSVLELGRDVIVADSFRDFSGISGTSNGSWYYGNAYMNGATYDPNSLTSMTYTRTAYTYEYDSVWSYAKVDDQGGHPSAGYGYPVVYPVWTVRRWTSNVAATAHIAGTAVRGSPLGDGTGLLVYVDGNLVYSVLVGGAGAAATVNFDFTAPIQVGSKVDFAITPGPGIDINNDYLDLQAKISVPPAAPTTFAAWQSQNFTAAEYIDSTISGATAAPAGDGVGNLFKYAINGNAKKYAAGAIPSVGTQLVSGSSYLTLSYRKATAPTDLTFATELNAGNLVSGPWTTGGVSVGTPVNNSDGTQTITIRDTVAISPGIPRRFMRLRVTKP